MNDTLSLTFSDPFDLDADASRGDVVLPRSGFARKKETVELLPAETAKRKKADFNAVQRRWFERHGWTYERVEHANAWGGMCKDLWGIADYLACHPEQGILLVQTTSVDGMRARRRKIRNAPELVVWLAAGGKMQIHGWFQPGGAGSRWEVRIEEVTP